MLLWSSELISSIGRLCALDVEAAGGVLLLGPQQVIGLLAHLRTRRRHGPVRAILVAHAHGRGLGAKRGSDARAKDI